MKTNWLFAGLLLLAGVVTAQAQFDYITYNGGAIITGYSGPGGALTIPATLGGLPVTGIEGSGFEDKGLTSVSIPATVTNMEVQQFSPNYSLTSFTVDSNNPAFSSMNGVLYNKSGTTLFEYPPGLGGSFAIPTNVTSVGQNAFAACYYLSGVTIPHSVTNIGATGFGYCFDLTSITIPTNVTSIGEDAFINCFNLPGITVTPGNPSYISVGGVLFDQAETTLLEYPTGLTGPYSVPNGVTTIGSNAFVLCDGLTGVTMPATVANIADGAFADCYSLTNVTLGPGVSYIATSAFGDCPELTAINVDPANPDFSSLDGVVFNKNQTTLVLFPSGFSGSYTTPASVTSIGAFACEDCSLTAVNITGNVSSIGFLAFQGCGELTNVTLANGVSSLGEFAFGDCPMLSTVTVPATITSLPAGVFAYGNFGSIYFQGNAPAADPEAFLGDSGTIYYLPGTSGWGSTFDGLPAALEDAPVPNGALQVTILPAGAVDSGAQWQVDGGLLQPGGATVFGLSVGSHTVSFTTVEGWMTPSNETVLITPGATNAITGTYGQVSAPPTDFTYVTNDGGITITGYTGAGGAVDIPSVITGLPVTQIGGSAFSFAGALDSITIPDSVTNLGDFAFDSCPALEAVTVSSGVTNIGEGVFVDCFSLTSVTCRGAITSIGDDAFASDSELSSFSIPDSVTNIGQYTFFGAGLTNVTIPAALTSIGYAAFADCGRLTMFEVDPGNPAYSSAAGVLFDKSQTALIQYPDGNPALSYTISNGVTAIGDNAFAYSSLAGVTMPPGLATIGNYSFEVCEALTNVIFPGSVTSIGNDAFALCGNLTGAFLPASVVNLGEVPFANCDKMSSIAVAPGNPAFSSTNGVLYDKSGTTLIEFPSGPTGGFVIPSGVGDIGEQAFGGSQLSSVTIPASVTNIEFSGFFNCLNLTNVMMTAGLQSVGVGAFEDCYALTNVILPATVTSIGDYAFAFSGNLKVAEFQGGAPPDDGTVFAGDTVATVYYNPAMTGWGLTFGGAPTVPLPDISTLNIAGTNLILHAINGRAGRTYIVLTSANPLLPLPQWLPVATNMAAGNGSFSITVTNTVSRGNIERFYILQTH